jgi:LacI family transcriptional regulator
MKNITITDIANEAKVSKSTVSRVLNNTSAVHPDKRRAILEATERLGFKPNVVARSLSKGRSMTIGVLTQNIGSPFYDSISQGVIAALGDTGYSPIFVDGQWQRGIEVEAIRALLGRRVDGLVLIGGEIPSDELDELCSPLPTVVVARRLPPGQHHCIYTDNVEGGYRATRCLLEHGHREIAFIGGILHHPDAVDRFEGYKKALHEAGIALQPALVLDGDFTAESGVRAVEELFAREQSFTAIFAANDTTAFGARLALYRRGVHVPDDVSIIGFDDQAESAFMASRALMALIDGKSFASRSLNGELMLRESVSRRG